MPDRWRERLTFAVALVSLLTSGAVALAGVSGKLGVLVVGPPDLIAQVRHEDSTRAAAMDSVLQLQIAVGVERHRAMDSTNAAQDAAIRATNVKLDMLIAVGCANFPRRDLGLSRLETACSSNLDRWRDQRGPR